MARLGYKIRKRISKWLLGDSNFNRGYQQNWNVPGAVMERLYNCNLEWDNSFENIYYLSLDSSISAAYQYIISTITKQEFKIELEDEAGEEIREFCELVIEDLDMNKIVSNMLDAILFGYSVQEILWEVRDGDVVVHDIVPISKQTLDNGIMNFEFDKNGKLLGFKQNQFNSFNIGDELIPIDKTLYFSFNTFDGSVLGQSILKGCYKEIKLKERILESMDIVTWRYGTPIIQAAVDKEFEDVSAVEKQIKDIIDGKAPGIVTAQENKMNLLEVNAKQDELLNVLRYLDKQILINIFNLEDRTTGSDTIASVQIGKEKMYTRMNSIILNLNNVLTDFLKRLVDYNFDNVNKYPKFVIEQLVNNDLLNLVQVLDKIGMDKTTETYDKLVKALIKDNSNIPISDEELFSSIDSSSTSSDMSLIRDGLNSDEQGIGFTQEETL